MDKLDKAEQKMLQKAFKKQPRQKVIEFNLVFDHNKAAKNGLDLLDIHFWISLN